MSITPRAPEHQRVSAENGDLEQAAAVFVAVRPRLQRAAYRILNSRAEAEDVVQDAWLRWQVCDRSAVRNSTAFLVTLTTRLAVNCAKSGRASREVSVGRWPDDPVDVTQDPTVGPERAEELEVGIRLLLERLSSTERTAYVLRHAFDYPYRSIAGILCLSEANTRQVVSRAGRRLASTESQRQVDVLDERHLVSAVLAATNGGELSALESALAA